MKNIFDIKIKDLPEPYKTKALAYGRNLKYLTIELFERFKSNRYPIVFNGKSLKCQAFRSVFHTHLLPEGSDYWLKILVEVCLKK